MKSPKLKINGVLPRSRFIRSVVVAAGGTVLGQGLIILSSPVLTRLYSPSEFGVFAVFSSLVSVVLVLASFRFEFAIPLPKDDSEGETLLKLSLLLVVVSGTFTAAGFGLFGRKLVEWARVPELGPFLWLVPVAMIGGGVYQALTYWMIRRQQFTVLSATKALQGLVQVIAQFIFGLAHFGPVGLLVGFVSGQVAGIGALRRRAQLKSPNPNARGLMTTARQHADFALFTAAAGVVSTIGTQIPNLLFARYFAVDTAGFFSLTLRVLAVPSALVGQAVAQVFYPVAAQSEQNEGGSGELVQRLTLILLLISVPIYSVVFLHGPELFRVAFGSEWAMAGTYAQYLVPWFIWQFVSSPLSSYVLVKGKQRAAFLVTIYETGLRFLSLWVGGTLGSDRVAVGLYGLAGSVISIAYVIWIMVLARVDVWKWIQRILVYCSVGAAVTLGLKMVLHAVNPILAFVISVGVLGAYSGAFAPYFLKGKKAGTFTV